LKVIPVLDILDGVAVHAVRGRRKEYKPLKSVLCASADPLEVATAFRNLGFIELYVADLNAIMDNGENREILEKIAKNTRLQLMVDAGAANITKARGILQQGASEVIVGTETLTDSHFVEQAVQSLGADRVIVSFDMKNGHLLSRFSLERFPDPIDVLCEFQKMGLSQAILLDLARVGSEEGIDWVFLRRVLEHVSLKVFVGGGVRNLDDLVKSSEMGVSGVLLATALHSGKITVQEIAAAGLSL
jgi:phosphoribosylformimino-5-aminoimidazole carboxamide ribotide isomerase